MDLFERIRRQKILTDAQLQQARSRVLSTHEDWATAICALKLAEERDVVRLLSLHTGFPGVELSRSVVPLTNLALLPNELVRQKLVFPMVDSDGGLIVAMANPDDTVLAAELGFMTGRNILRHVAVPGLLKAAIEACPGLAQSGEQMWRGRDAWKLSPGPEGVAAIVRPEEQSDAPASDAEAKKDEEEMVIVGVLDPSFDTPELPPNATKKEPPKQEPPKQASAQHLVKTTMRAGVGVGKVVLVVDDDAQIRALMVRILEPFGCAILQADDGRKGLAAARDARPNLVVLDAMLPGMHGFEVCRAIKGDPELRQTAVIMMSGVHTGWKVGVDVAEVYGADGFFEKPFQVEDFSRAIRRCLMVGGGAEERSAKAARAAALASCKEAAANARAGKLREAIALLNTAAAQDPCSAEPHYYLGQVLHAAGDSYRAIASLERAVDLRPDLEAPLVKLAELYKLHGFRKSAREVLQRALDICHDPARRAQLTNMLNEVDRG